MFFPIGDDNPTRRTPVVTWTLIALNVAVFVLLNPPNGTLAYQDFISGFGFKASAPLSLELLSSMFMHANWMHLLGNMWFLHLFGDNVEDKVGRGRYLLLYLAGGVAACWAYTFVDRVSPGGGPQLAEFVKDGIVRQVLYEPPLVGASGAIATVTGLYLVLFPEARIRCAVWWGLFMFLAVRAKWFLGITLLMDVFRTISAMGPAYANVATSAHVGGGVFGIAAALLLKRRIGGSGEGSVWDVHTGFSSGEIEVPADWASAHRRTSVLRTVDPPEDLLISNEDRITELVRSDRLAEAGRLYPSYEAHSREKPLPPDVQIAIAHEFYRQALPLEALRAYQRYLETHPRGGDAAESKFRMGVLQARAFNRPAEAVRLLREAHAEHPDRRVAAYAREELRRLGVDV